MNYLLMNCMNIRSYEIRFLRNNAFSVRILQPNGSVLITLGFEQNLYKTTVQNDAAHF